MKKLALKELKLKSFVTDLDNKGKQTIAGGAQTYQACPQSDFRRCTPYSMPDECPILSRAVCLGK